MLVFGFEIVTRLFSTGDTIGFRIVSKMGLLELVGDLLRDWFGDLFKELTFEYDLLISEEDD